MQDAINMSAFCIENLIELEYVFRPTSFTLEMSQTLINDLEKGLRSIKYHQTHEPLDYHVYFISNYYQWLKFLVNDVNYLFDNLHRHPNNFYEYVIKFYYTEQPAGVRYRWFQ